MHNDDNTEPPRTTHQTGFKNKTGRTQDFFLYIKGKIILQLSDTTNEEEERGVPGRRKACYGRTA
ncbi:hypothetical protein O6P32_11905, partial [Phocaeicola sp. KGMB11183]